MPVELVRGGMAFGDAKGCEVEGMVVSTECGLAIRSGDGAGLGFCLMHVHEARVTGS